MTSIRTARTIATLGALALLAGAFLAPPAQAKKKKPKPCAPYASPEWATGAETSVITDAATADAPVEVEITTDPGLGFTNPAGPTDDTGPASHKFHNVQVDSAAPTATLHVRAEYTPAFDNDLFLRAPEMPAVAYEADFNPATAAGPTPVGGYEGGYAEPGVSEILGYSTFDCAGFTVDIASGISPGGPVTVKVWLGE